MTAFAAPRQRLPFPYRDEIEVVSHRLASLSTVLDWAAAAKVATPWVQAVRQNPMADVPPTRPSYPGMPRTIFACGSRTLFPECMTVKSGRAARCGPPGKDLNS